MRANPIAERASTADVVGTMKRAAPAVEEWRYAPRRTTPSVPSNLNAGLKAFSLLRDGRTDEVSTDAAFAAESLVALVGRPAIQLRSGRLTNVPSSWKSRLSPHVPAIETVARSVGRIEPAGFPAIPLIGTAFMVGPGILMTNRHVAEVIASEADGVWTFIPSLEPRIDFRSEYGKSRPLEFTLVEVLEVSDRPEIDLALLRVGVAKGRRMPKPLRLAKTYKPRTKAEVYVVGHPAFDAQAPDRQQELQRMVFQNVFDVKRVAPGELLPVDGGMLTYDASTLGGNSGSCVVDLESGEVVGLHFGGTYLKANYAVPLWKLRTSAMLRRHPLNFME